MLTLVRVYATLVVGNTTNQGAAMEEYLTRLKKKNLVDIFIGRFEELILSGKLAIGENLPSERELAAKLGVSRPVVHEGLLDLQTKGLISKLPAGGAVINDYRQDGSLTMLNSLLTFNDGRLEPKLAESSAEFRLLIEVENARLAAKNRSMQQLIALQDTVVEEKNSDPTQIEKISQLDFKFHHQIAMATNNIIYPLLVNSFKVLYINHVTLFYSDPAMVPQVIKFHVSLVDAIADQHEKKAVEVMRAMLDHGMAYFLAPIIQDK